MWSSFLRAQFTFFSDPKYTIIFKNKHKDNDNNNNNNKNHNDNDNDNDNHNNNNNNNNNSNNNNNMPLCLRDFPHPSFHPMVFSQTHDGGEIPQVDPEKPNGLTRLPLATLGAWKKMWSENGTGIHRAIDIRIQTPPFFWNRIEGSNPTRKE